MEAGFLTQDRDTTWWKRCGDPFQHTTWCLTDSLLFTSHEYGVAFLRVADTLSWLHVFCVTLSRLNHSSCEIYALYKLVCVFNSYLLWTQPSLISLEHTQSTLCSGVSSIWFQTVNLCFKKLQSVMIVISRVVNWTSVIRWPVIKPMIGLRTP